jgi:Coenzyme PQQ synthesis protein D (PqqD)
MSITLESVISRNESNFLANPVGEEIIILNMETGDYLGLNQVGSDIWDLLETPTTVQKIIDQLIDRYAVDKDTCQTETMEYVDKINSLGLLRVQG